MSIWITFGCVTLSGYFMFKTIAAKEKGNLSDLVYNQFNALFWLILALR